MRWSSTTSSCHPNVYTMVPPWSVLATTPRTICHMPLTINGSTPGTAVSRTQCDEIYDYCCASVLHMHTSARSEPAATTHCCCCAQQVTAVAPPLLFEMFLPSSFLPRSVSHGARRLHVVDYNLFLLFSSCMTMNTDWEQILQPKAVPARTGSG